MDLLPRVYPQTGDGNVSGRDFHKGVGANNGVEPIAALHLLSGGVNFIRVGRQSLLC
jgi:hypothetical protein